MIRSAALTAAVLALVGSTATPVLAQSSRARAEAEKAKTAAAQKPNLVATHGDWGAYMTQTGKAKVCYAMTQPKDRKPGNLERDPAYIFVSYRPAESVRGEVSIMLGFPLKESDSTAEIGRTKFALITKGNNAWVRNAAEEAQFVEAMRKGPGLVIKAYSARGNMTTDSYSLSGFAAALDRVQKECR